HTSFSRDWSSDVCSSDLALVDVVRMVVQELPQYLVPLPGAQAFSALLSVLQERGDELIDVGGVGVDLGHGCVILRSLWVDRGGRSEERRVGSDDLCLYAR